MQNLILCFSEPREEYADADVVLPFRYESAESARTDLGKLVSDYATCWTNYYRKKLVGATYPPRYQVFAGHSLDLNSLVDFVGNNMENFFEIFTLEDWFAENLPK